MRKVFGRAQDCDIVISDPYVSQHHGVLIVENGHVYIEDTGSKNGIKVNGRKISGRTSLKPGAEVKLGPAYHFEWGEYVNVTLIADNYEDETIMAPQDSIRPSVRPKASKMRSSSPSPLVEIPAKMEFNHNQANVYRNGSEGADWKVPFKRNMGDKIGNAVGSTLGCLLSIGIVAAVIAIIAACVQ